MHGWKEAWDAATGNPSLVLANWALVAVAAIAGCVAWLTLRQIRQQAKTAYAALVAQFRPRIIVRKIELDPPSCDVYLARKGGDWRVVLSLVNTGGTVAHIRKCEAKFYWYKGVTAQMLKQIASTTREPFDMASGDRTRIEVAILSETGLASGLDDAGKFHSQLAMTEEVVLKQGHEQDLFPICSGTIQYTDDRGAIKPETGFWRAYHLKTQQFVASGDPEHEFCD
jgi:hypothetical protein